MIDLDSLKDIRAWQAKNRRALYIGGGAFAFAVLIADLIAVLKGLK